ncbi:MAG TPA: glycosyltransferase 87 family protein [Acidimicrobiales bacterium]|nr:glycosyltransferase 87 family protein [Acidimicrobiales bacterium]
MSNVTAPRQVFTTLDVMLARLWNVRDHFMNWWTALGTLTGDGLLYLVAAAFALMLGLTSSQPAQWQWGYLSVGPYLLIAVLALVLGRRALRREHVARVILLGSVIVGVVFVPLALETHWRQAQPEVGVIERSGALLSKGLDPYRAYQKNGQIVNEIKGLPAFESFFPYFPLMSVFGLPSADTKQSKGLTDARIVMTLMTLIVSGWALALLRLSKSQKLRVAQVLIALPTGALFLSTGGDDMPILALLLLGVAALQRRQSNLAGISLGLAAAMKLTAWPLAAGALLVARNPEGRATWRRVLLWVGAIVLVTTVPFVLKAPAAFMSNVFAFPLGLAGVASPAASALPGHILTTWIPVLGHVLAPVALLIGGYFVTKYVRAHWPLTLSQLLGVLCVVFTVMMCVATATRAGYVIYPLNFALWAAMTQQRTVEAPVLVAQEL